MSYIIISDSSVNFENDVCDKMNLKTVPFRIYIDGEELVDKDLDKNLLLSKLRARKGKASTACPPPNEYFELLDENLDNYILTISSKLSGSHNAATIAMNEFKEKFPNSNVAVIDSESAAAGQDLVAITLHNLIEQGLPFDEVVTRIRSFIETENTYFVLNGLENLAKNGRLSKLKALAGTILNLFPILGDDGHGEIEQKAIAIGRKKAHLKLVSIVAEKANSTKNKILCITHVNCYDVALFIKEKIEALNIFKEIIINSSKGLSATYTEDLGIVVAF